MVHGGTHQHRVGVTCRRGVEIDLGAAQRRQSMTALQGVGDHVSLRLHALKSTALLRRLRSTRVRRCVLEESAAPTSSPAWQSGWQGRGLPSLLASNLVPNTFTTPVS